ncbi:MAG: NADH-quinone oxidoreductase subunit M [Bacteroidetes bacterium]|nr:NADH-quinone oxidoreductase subunit M [Bacteroidota bacterium]
MTFIDQYILSILTFSPIIGVIILFLFRVKNSISSKTIGLISSIITFAISIYIYSKFDLTQNAFQFVQANQLFIDLDIKYAVGIDGLSLILILLTTFLTPITILSAFKSIEKRVNEFIVMMLMLEVGMIGVFVSTDLFLFYIFWEAILIPMYFIIGIWGGQNRIYATIKFFIFTMAGSLLMLVAILWMGNYAVAQSIGKFSTDYLVLLEIAKSIPENVQLYLFLAFTISFAIKVPLFPLHTWLPDAHVEAPTAGSVILAGVLLKMGTYGLVRFSLPLFPMATIYFTPLFATLAVFGIIYGALVSLVQTDLKKLVAYSSVSHLGFVVLGIFAATEESIQGSILQMVNHGLSTGALFLLVGMIYERRHTREISDFGGLAKSIPIFSTFFMIVTLSSIGLPGLNGFVGEFLILVGSFNSSNLNSNWFTIFATSGVILSAVYMLWMFQRVIFGKIKNEANSKISDLSKREVAVLVPIIIFIIWIGVYPTTFLSISSNSTKKVVAYFEKNNQSQTMFLENK